MIKKALENVRAYHVKAKRCDNGETVIGFLWFGANHAYVTPENFGIGYSNEDKNVSACAYEVDKNTICRFTGTENFYWSSEEKSWIITPIWEGDVIEHKTFDDFLCISEVKIGEYTDDVYGGEYEGERCYGVYAKILKAVPAEDMEMRDFKWCQIEQNILHLDKDCKVIGNIRDGFDEDVWMKNKQQIT